MDHVVETLEMSQKLVVHPIDWISTHSVAVWAGKSSMVYQARILLNYHFSHASPTPYHIPFQFSPFFLLPMPEHTCPDIAELFPWSVYAYTGIQTQNVKCDGFDR